ncbi:hypothetical protein SeLEV6574_g03102 [Synchytrium endobioticum]|nr:hypothetical protein SeLEV6574_g03102 [Synchytrium endobioticum]
MSDKVRIALCEHKQKNPSLTQNQLRTWLESEHSVKVSQATISTTLKRSGELLEKANSTNLATKRQRTVKYPLMETALMEWFTANQERVNMSGDLIKENGAKVLDRLYPDHPPFEFSNRWLEAFKARHGIHSFRRFGESGSVDVNFIEDERPKIQEVLDKFELCDIYNMVSQGSSEDGPVTRSVLDAAGGRQQQVHHGTAEDEGEGQHSEDPPDGPEGHSGLFPSCLSDIFFI